MAGSRTLKLSILADIDDLKKNLNVGSNEVEGFSGKLGKFGKIAGAAFAAAGAAAAAYAGKLAIDGVKAAIEDEAAQVRLANALRNTVGATEAQIASTESFILKSSLATGVADDELRPAFERLTRSTKDTEEAQKLTNLALDIAAAKNISVTTAANALAKANDGQVGALKKLGITLGDNATNLADYTRFQKILAKAQNEANFALEQYGPKSKEYLKASEKVAEITQKTNDIAAAGIDVFGELGREFAGAASESANTFQGKLDRLNVAFGEAKETVGSFILDAITPLVSGLVNVVVPAVQNFIESIGGTEGLKGAFSSFIDGTKKLFIPIFEALVFTFDKIKEAVAGNSEAFEALYNFAKNFLAPFLGGVLKIAIQAIGTAIAAVVTLVGKLIEGFTNIIKLGAKVGNFIGGLNPFGGERAMGGPVSTGRTYLVGERGPELFTPSGSGSIIPNNKLGSGSSGGTTININVSGAVDPISTARQIADILSNAATSVGSFSNLGLSRVVSV